MYLCYVGSPLRKCCAGVGLDSVLVPCRLSIMAKCCAGVGSDAVTCRGRCRGRCVGSQMSPRSKAGGEKRVKNLIAVNK